MVRRFFRRRSSLSSSAGGHAKRMRLRARPPRNLFVYPLGGAAEEGLEGAFAAFWGSQNEQRARGSL